MKKKLYLHIGYAKSASTLLQKKILPLIPETNYIGRSYNKKEKNEWVYRLAFQENFSEDIPNEFLSANSQKNIFSHEVLLRPSNTTRSLIRIKNLFSKTYDIKIILCIRNQVSMLPSRIFHTNKYVQGEVNFDKIINTKNLQPCTYPNCANEKYCTCKQYGHVIITPNFYNYLYISEIISEIFGKKSIHIVTSECFHKQETAIQELKKLYEFLEVESNITRNYECTCENKQFDRNYEKFKSLFKQKQFEKIKNLYSEYNKKINDKYELELYKYKYF